MFKKQKEALRKAAEMVALMKSDFPGAHVSGEIMFWEDESFSARCRYCDPINFLHIYRYDSSKDRVIKTEYDVEKDGAVAFMGVKGEKLP